MRIIVLSLILATFSRFVSAQVNEMAKVTIPGTLNTVAKTYSCTVTNLTVTGTIHARDFKTMRDSMPALTVIELS